MLLAVAVVVNGSESGNASVIAAIAIIEADGIAMKSPIESVVGTGPGLRRRITAVRIGVEETIGIIVMIVTGETEIAEIGTDVKTVVNALETVGTAEIAMTEITVRADTGTVMTDTTTALDGIHTHGARPLLVVIAVPLLTEKATATPANLVTTTVALVTLTAVTVPSPTAAPTVTPTTPNPKSKKKRNASANSPKCSPMPATLRKPVVDASTKSPPWKSVSARRTRRIVRRRVGLSGSCIDSCRRIVLMRGFGGVVVGWLLIGMNSLFQHRGRIAVIKFL